VLDDGEAACADGHKVEPLPGCDCQYNSVEK
jgi:hypothetical protein